MVLSFRALAGLSQVSEIDIAPDLFGSNAATRSLINCDSERSACPTVAVCDLSKVDGILAGDLAELGHSVSRDVGFEIHAQTIASAID